MWKRLMNGGFPPEFMFEDEFRLKMNSGVDEVEEEEEGRGGLFG